MSAGHFSCSQNIQPCSRILKFLKFWRKMLKFDENRQFHVLNVLEKVYL